MLRIALDVLPYGDPSRPMTIAQGFIANDGKSTDEAFGSYDFAFTETGVGLSASGRVERFARAEGALALLQLVEALGVGRR